MKIPFILSFQQRQESLYSRSQRQNGEAHESFGYEQGIFVLINIDQRFFRQKKEEEEYSGFENGKGEDCQAKTVVQVRKFEITIVEKYAIPIIL